METLLNTDALPLKAFASAQVWEQWLGQNHAKENGLWVQIAKKASGLTTATYEEALDAALCYGWIDGQRKTGGPDHFLQKFTPRRPKSLWSQRNVVKAEQLISEKRMRPAGLAEVEAARRDGRWQAA